MFTTIDIQGLLFKRQYKNIINLILKTINIDSELSFFFHKYLLNKTVMPIIVSVVIIIKH